MLNHITIQGRLTRDPELRRTGSGTAVASFSVACDRDFSKEKEVDFIDCVAWGKTGEFVSGYFAKGASILVSGRLQMRSYTDKSGSKRTAAEVVAESVHFCGSKAERTESADPYFSKGASVSTYSAPVSVTPGPDYPFALLEDDDADLPY